MKSKSLDLKIGWCVWNIALLVPVLIPLFVGRGLPISMPGFLSYCYALVAVGYYLFDQHLKIATQDISYTSTKKSLSILAMIIIIVLYALYDPVQSSISTVILAIVSTIIFLIAFLLAYYLSVPLLKRQETEEERREEEMASIMSRRQKTGESAKKNAEAIVEEELNEDN